VVQPIPETALQAPRRPALCRPALFRSDKSSLFPAPAFEKRQLLLMSPPEWKPESSRATPEGSSWPREGAQ
jgi:hypothetical protein